MRSLHSPVCGGFLCNGRADEWRWGFHSLHSRINYQLALYRKSRLTPSLHHPTGITAPTGPCASQLPNCLVLLWESSSPLFGSSQIKEKMLEIQLFY